eukprot:2849902-Prorocentrum_lima.AAC.1
MGRCYGGRKGRLGAEPHMGPGQEGCRNLELARPTGRHGRFGHFVMNREGNCIIWPEATR